MCQWVNFVEFFRGKDCLWLLWSDVLIDETWRSKLALEKSSVKREKEARVKGDEGREQIFSMRKQMFAFPRIEYSDKMA